jgi:hypothetical protein
MSRILVIGGTGRISKLLCEELLQHNNYVICLDDTESNNCIDNTRYIFRIRDISLMTPEDVSSNLDYVYFFFRRNKDDNLARLYKALKIAEKTGSKFIFITTEIPSQSIDLWSCEALTKCTRNSHIDHAIVHIASRSTLAEIILLTQFAESAEQGPIVLIPNT